MNGGNRSLQGVFVLVFIVEYSFGSIFFLGLLTFFNLYLAWFLF